MRTVQTSCDSCGSIAEPLENHAAWSTMVCQIRRPSPSDPKGTVTLEEVDICPQCEEVLHAWMARPWSLRLENGADPRLPDRENAPLVPVAGDDVRDRPEEVLGPHETNEPDWEDMLGRFTDQLEDIAAILGVDELYDLYTSEPGAGDVPAGYLLRMEQAVFTRLSRLQAMGMLPPEDWDEEKHRPLLDTVVKEMKEAKTRVALDRAIVELQRFLILHRVDKQEELALIKFYEKRRGLLPS